MTLGTRFLEFILYCETTLGQYIQQAFQHGNSSYTCYFNSKYQYLEVVDGKLSYLAANRPLKYLENEQIDFSNFQTGKPAKIVRSMLSKEGIDQFEDGVYENFNNCFLSNFENQPITFERHRRFAEVYRKTPRKEGTVLAKSCMQKKSSSYFEFYSAIPQCSILECTQQGELVGRALIWEVDGETYMDRIYAENPLILEEYYAYANKHGFYRKWKQDYETQEYWINPEGIPIHKSLSIPVNLELETAPYLDTFKYYSDKEHRLHTGLGDTSREFSSTECSYKSRDIVLDGIKDTHFCKITGYWTNPERLKEIGAGFYKGKKVHESYIVRVEGNDYYSRDPQIGNFFLPEYTDFKYQLINPEIPIFRGNGWVMYVKDIERGLQEEAKTIYGSKPLHKRLNLMINQSWTTTNGQR